ncbi:hypothetical protein GCM10007424_11920 [Flavobacterium suaedae]|uniref:Uncharacterized protein n=1 Tax=Flavobacterium suaedae TaxID=1767027 RepID=A0ABQ1JRK8_9FLAO|nr:hypothetical protein GCM10007424_11920 [Flavobacterium suaedae]
MAVNTIAISPAAGPDTLICELLNEPIIIPPIIPDSIPDNGGAPEANAIPKHNGNATKKTTKPDGKSALRLAKRFTFLDMIKYNIVSMQGAVVVLRPYAFTCKR